MPSLSEMQKSIAAHITDLPPAAQGHVMEAVALAWRAGYEDCQRAFRQAADALKGRTNGVSEQRRQS